jgi:tetratricopeptide (TPR) repeat protein
LSSEPLGDVPLDPDAAFAQGCALLEQDDPAKAVPFLEAAVQGADLRADFHAQLAVAYYHTGRVDEAIDQFQQTIELEPKFDEAHYSLGVIYAEREQEEEAINAFQRCLNLNPRHAEARHSLSVFTRQREERLLKEVGVVREPPPPAPPERDDVPLAPVETKVVREPVQRTSTPYIIAAMWALWAVAFGVQSLGLLFLAAMLPDLLLEMRQVGMPPVSSQEIQAMQIVLYVFVFFSGLMMIGGLSFVVANIRRWGCAFYGNIVAALLFVVLQMCSMASSVGGGGSELADSSISPVSIVMAGICVLGPPIIVIALTVFARGDYQKQTYTVVPEEEQLPTGDATDYYNRGLRRSKRGKLDQAIADWEAAVRLEPGDVAFRNVLALGYAEQRRYAQAVEQLEAALQIAPNDRMTLENLQIVRDLQAEQG